MKKLISAAILILGLNSCSDNSTNQPTDTTTSGSITISCDESLKPMIDAEEAVFEELYPNAEIKIVYTNEQDAINLVLQDSARLAIVTRKMTNEEEAILKEQKIARSRANKIAYDAIGFILHPENKDTIFTVEQIAGILSGKISDWSQINPKNKQGSIQVVFDNPSSGAIRMLKDSLHIGKDLGKNCFAVKSNPEVISHVEKNKNSIGIIGVSWISDPDDSLVRYFMKKVNVAEIQPKKITIESITWKPIQGNIHLRQYPFWREVFTVSREARTGLGTGFASFMAGDQGQRIILKAGLVPSRAAIRTIEIY